VGGEVEEREAKGCLDIPGRGKVEPFRVELVGSICLEARTPSPICVEDILLLIDLRDLSFGSSWAIQLLSNLSIEQNTNPLA